MSLRGTNIEKLEHQKPDVFKSDAEKAHDGIKDTLDNAASYLPGQSQPRDAFSSDARDPTQAGASRGGTGTMLDSLKPSGEKAKVEGDKDDMLTPNNESGVSNQNNTKGAGETVAQMAVDAKNAVTEAFTTEHSTTTTTGHDGLHRPTAADNERL